MNKKPKGLARVPTWSFRPVGGIAYKDWLCHTDSLTQRLKAHSGDFSITPVRQFWGCLHGQRVLWREVVLRCDGVAVVFARSVFPHRALIGKWRKLGSLGTRSLGELLFTDPGVARQAVGFRQLSAHERFFARIKAVTQFPEPVDRLWMRRSWFRVGRAEIVVEEVFLPGVLNQR